MNDAAETRTQRWRVDSTPWLTSIQQQRVWEADRVIEGTTGRVAALLYGILEIRMSSYMAHLAILGGDPDHPAVLFRHPDIACEDHVEWHAEDRFLSVRVPMSKKTFWRTRYVIAPCVFDLTNRTFTFIPLSNGHFIRLTRMNDGWSIEESKSRPASIPSHAGEHFRDQDLRWAGWEDVPLASERFFAGWFGTIQ